MNSNKLSSRPLTTINKGILIAILIASFLGFLDASYLTISHYQGSVPPCTVGNGCELVLTSRYATIAGIPVALAGTVYYFLVFMFTMLYRNHGRADFLKYSMYLVYAGCIASLALLYIQVFLLRSLCPYCLGSITLTFILLGLHSSALRAHGRL